MAKRTTRGSHRKPRMRRTKPHPLSRTDKERLLSWCPSFRKGRYRSTDRAKTQRLLASLRESIRTTGIVLFLGSGVSRSLGFHTWATLTRLVATAAALRRSRSLEPTSASQSPARRVPSAAIYYHLCENLATPEQFLIAASAAQRHLGKEFEWITSAFLYSDVPHDKLPLVPTGDGHGRARRKPAYIRRTSPLIAAIASLVRSSRDLKGVHAIINYNFDDVVDEHLRALHVQCRTIVSGKDRPPAFGLPIYHVHGILRYRDFIRGRSTRRIQNAGNFVFTEDDYHTEYSDPYRWSNLIQMSALSSYPGLFVGLSLRDPNLRRLIDTVHQGNPRRWHYAILPRAVSLARSRDNARTLLRNLLEDLETSALHAIGINVIWVDSYRDVPRILAAIAPA